jgi:hypothetical protein
MIIMQAKNMKNINQPLHSPSLHTLCTHKPTNPYITPLSQPP